MAKNKNNNQRANHQGANQGAQQGIQQNNAEFAQENNLNVKNARKAAKNQNQNQNR